MRAELRTVWTSLASIPLKSPFTPSALIICLTIRFHLIFSLLMCYFVLITVKGYVQMVEIILDRAPIRKITRSCHPEDLSTVIIFFNCSYITNWMIGFETKVNDEDSPFHKAVLPSLSMSYFPFSIIDPFSFACLVCKTQNGFVANVAPIPAIVEHLMVSKTEPGTKPRYSLHFS